jgi:hypothetical protein
MKLVQFACVLIGGMASFATSRIAPDALSAKLAAALKVQTAAGLFERELQIDGRKEKSKSKFNTKSVGNKATGNWSQVSGGAYNEASEVYTAIGGGFGNEAEAPGATVDGGQNNTASGFSSTVAGGDFNTASGVSSFVVGYHGSALDDDSAVFAFTGSAATGCRSQGAGTVSICAPNGLFVNGVNIANTSNVPYQPDPVEQREAIEGRNPFEETPTRLDLKIAELQAKSEEQESKIKVQDATISELLAEMTKLKLKVSSILFKEAK